MSALGMISIRGGPGRSPITGVVLEGVGNGGRAVREERRGRRREEEEEEERRFLTSNE